MLRRIFEDMCVFLEEEVARKAEELLNIEDLSKLSVNDVDYLEVIEKKGNPTLGEIAMELNFSKPSVTSMVNKLVKGGFVNKVQSKDDKRVFYVELTDLGKDIIELQLSVYRDFAIKLEKVLDSSEVEKLADLLGKGLRAVKKK